MSNTVLRVGLTGNIAAGKSTVGAWMVELGCHLIDADRLAHQCLEPGEPTFDGVVDAFGRDLVGDDGGIDRSTLAALVFDDAEALMRLEAILHPAIRVKEQHQVDEVARRSSPAVVVTEAALLYETGSADRYQRMVVVIAPTEVRLDRLAGRGLSEHEGRRRMAAQMDQADKAARADYVIDNGGPLESGRKATRTVCAHLQEDLTRWRRGSPLGPPDVSTD